MDLLTFGINHKTASIGVREKVAFTPEQMTDALRHACANTPLKELTILSTCNRTELYGLVEPDHSGKVIEWLASYKGVAVTEFDPCYYLYHNEVAVKHMLRVASGLDSMVLGEPQILGQLKSAFVLAQQAGTAGPALGRLFRHTFNVAKKVRTDTAIGENSVSVAFTAVNLAKRIFSDLKECNALLLGAGETIELVARHLIEQGVKNVVVANRTRERAQALAEKLPITPIALSELPLHLANADIIITSTASQLPILGKGAIERALKARKHRPMFMVDLAVPRDIEAEVAELNDVYLYSIDDLQAVIAEHMKLKEGAAQEADAIIDSSVVQFVQQLRALEAVDVLKSYRGQVEKMKSDELQKAQRAIEKGEEVGEVLEQLANALTNKFLHTPSIKIKEASALQQHDKLNWAQELFGLDQLDDVNKP